MTLNDIELKRFSEIRDDVKKMIAPSKIEETFDILVTVNPKRIESELETYNIYRKSTGELLFSYIKPWDLEEMLATLGNDMANILKKNANEEKQTNIVDSFTKQTNEEYKQYRKENYAICPVCFCEYNPAVQIHYHLI